MNVDAEKLVSHADLLETLRILWSLPTPAIANALADGTLSDDLVACLTEVDADTGEALVLRERVAGANAVALRDRLRIEYTRLFNNPVAAMIPLCEGSFKRMMAVGRPSAMYASKTAVAVSDFMRGCGFLPADNFVEPLDHLTAELSFVRALLVRAALALKDGNEEAFARSARAAASFYVEHLASWLYDFAEDVQGETHENVYRLISGATLAARPSLNHLMKDLEGHS